MQDILTMLNAIQRPALLMRAARIGAEDYRRLSHLPRLFGYGVLPGYGASLLRLIEMEALSEKQRVEKDASYNLVRHLDILIAMVAEARAFKTAKASASKQIT